MGGIGLYLAFIKVGESVCLAFIKVGVGVRVRVPTDQGNQGKF